jgi:hypothetical protein
MYKMKVTKSYMKSVRDCVKCPKGQDVELPEDIAKAWLKNGFCEEVSKKKFSPVEETAVINPVEETKSKGKRKSKKK